MSAFYNHLTSGSGPFPHFPCCKITLVVETNSKPQLKAIKDRKDRGQAVGLSDCFVSLQIKKN